MEVEVQQLRDGNDFHLFHFYGRILVIVTGRPSSVMKVDEHSGQGVDIHILRALQLNLHHALNHDLGHLGPLPQ